MRRKLSQKLTNSVLFTLGVKVGHLAFRQCREVHLDLEIRHYHLAKLYSQRHRRAKVAFGTYI